MVFRRFVLQFFFAYAKIVATDASGMESHEPLFWPYLMKILFRFTILALLSIQLAYAETISGRVVSIADGDTITVLTPEKDQVRIRLSEIDAPEKSQDFGQASKQSLSNLVLGKDVLVQAEGLDKYGRTVGTVMVGGVDANLQQLAKGLA